MRPEKGFPQVFDRVVPVKLDDQPMGELLTSAFVYLDVPAGRHEVSSDFWDIPGVTRHRIDAASGRTYYIVAKVNKNFQDVVLASNFVGIAGYALATSAAGFGKDRGAIDLIQLSDAEGARLLVELQERAKS